MQIIEQLWTPLLQILLITNLQLFQSSPFGLVFRFWHCVCMKITPDLQKKTGRMSHQPHINFMSISRQTVHLLKRLCFCDKLLT